MKIRTCAYCGERKECLFMRSVPRSLNQLVLVAAGILAYCQGDLESLHCLYLTARTTRKFMCHVHFAEVAVGLVSELAIRGIALKVDESGDAPRKYVLAKEIPDNLMTHLSICERRITDTDSCLIRNNVALYLYDALERYYENNAWKFIAGDRFEAIRMSTEEYCEHDTKPPKRPKTEIDNFSQRDAEFNTGLELERVTTVSGHSPRLDTSGSVYDVLDEVRVEDAHPILLRKYFLVEGEQLLQLFKFCPQCGRKLPKKAGARLIVRGTTPVVQYTCTDCFITGESSRWEGQKRPVSHS